MLDIELDEPMGIAIVRPDGALSENDFDVISSVIDPYLDQHEKLAGLIISTETFPGWESFDSFLKHFNFVNGHHKNRSRGALNSESLRGHLAEKMARHFVGAKIKDVAVGRNGGAKEGVVEGG